MTIVFGLMIPVFLALLAWPGSLTLAPEGFTIHNLRRATTLPWSDIAEFGIMRMSFRGIPIKRAGFRYREGDLTVVRQLSIGLTGYDGALPDSYGLKAEQLVALLEEWRVAESAALRS